MAISKNFIDPAPGSSGEKLKTPPPCPKCHSTETSSAAKRPTSHSYWRCLDCGEVFNPSLLSTPGGRWWQR